MPAELPDWDACRHFAVHLFPGPRVAKTVFVGCKGDADFQVIVSKCINSYVPRNVVLLENDTNNYRCLRLCPGICIL